jgi:hypothetical protein
MSNCVYYSCSGCMQTKRGYELFFLPNWCPHRCKWQRRWLQIQRQSLRLHISWSFEWPNAPQCHLMCYVLRSCQWFGSEMWHIFAGDLPLLCQMPFIFGPLSLSQQPALVYTYWFQMQVMRDMHTFSCCLWQYYTMVDTGRPGKCHS